MMNQSMPSRLRWTILAAIWVTYVINYLDRVSVLVFLPIIREDLHFTHIQIAQAASVFFLAYSMTLIFLGWTSDRFRPTFMMKLSISIFSIVTFFTGLMRQFSHFIIIRIFLGFGEGLHFPSILRTIGNWFPKDEKGRAVAIFATTWGIGPAFIPILVTWLATVIGGWRAVFMVLFIPGLIAILLVMLFIFDSPDFALRRNKVSEQEYNYIESGLVKIKGETGLSFKRQLGIVLGDPSYCFYCLMMFCQSGAFWGSTSWLSSFLYEQHKFKLVEMGAMASLPYVAGTCAMLTAGWSMDRIFGGRVRPVLFFSYVLTAGAFYFVSYVPVGHTAALVLALIVLGFFMNLQSGVSYSYPQVRYPKEVVGFASGFSNGAGQFGAFTAPLVAGYLVRQTPSGPNFAYAFVFFAALNLLALVCTVFMKDGVYAYKGRIVEEAEPA